MALVARYRLNGSISDSTGKTSFNPALMLQPKVFSISIWCKVTDKSNYRGLYGMHLDTGAGGTTTGIAMQFDSGYLYLILGSGVGGKWHTLTMPAANVPLNALFNLTVIADGKNIKMYIDGVDANAQFKDAYTGTVGNFETATITLGSRFFIGRGHESVDRYFKGTLEDLRIYDHALSTKEFKEILKAKILHLSMDTYEEPTTNLIPDGNFSRKTYQLPYLNSGFNNATAAFTDGDSSTPCKGNVLELTSTGADSYMSPYNGLGARLVVVAPGETYTYSFYSKAKSSPSCKPGISLFFLDASGVYDVTSFRQNWTVGTEWVRNSFTFTVPAGKTGISIRIENQEVGTTAQYNGLQLEKKPYVTPFSDGARYKGNMHFEAYNIYNNLSIPSSLVATGEYYLGEKVYRLTMTPTTQAQVDSMKVIFFDHGIFATSMTFLANTKYATSCLWKPISKPDTIVGGVASNITGFVEGPREKFKDGWNRYNRYRIGEATDKTDGIYISAISPSFVLGDSLVIDFCGLRTEKDTIYCSKYYNGIIEDKSDFGNHVNITDMITAVPYTEDSKLGKQALAFDGKMRPIAFSKIVPGCLTNCTVAFWRKSTSAGYELILNEKDSRLSETSDGYFMAKDATHFYSQPTKVTGNQNLYVDGVLRAKDNLNGLDDGNWHHVVMSGVNLSLFSKLMMNTYSAPGVSGANDWHMKSTIDDFRIYATELSQADVIELYKVRTSIDKLGNIFTGTIEPNEVEDGLIAYYPLNGDVLDHKNNYDGIINSGTSYASGMKGRNGIKITASTDTITFPTLPVLPKEKTLSFWIKSDRPLSANDDLWIGYFNISDSTPGGKFGMMYGVGQCQDLGFWGYANDFSVEDVSNKWSSDGSWHHVVITEDTDRKIKIYIDGVQKKIVSHGAQTVKIDFLTLQSDTIASNTFSIKTYTGQAWTGMTYCQFQDIRIYNKTLTSDVITKLYNWSHEKFSISKKGSIKANKLSTRGVIDKLIHHWKLDGGTLDSVGSCNSIEGTATQAAGLNQKSYDFNGTSNYFYSPRTALKGGNAPFSLSFWMKIDALGNVVSKRYSPVGIGIAANNSCCLVDLWDNGTIQFTSFYNDIVSTEALKANEWVHITFTYDGTVGTIDGKKIYKNGVKMNTVNTGSTDYGKPLTLPVNPAISIGYEKARNTSYFDGKIQDVKLYAKVLTPGEVLLNYNLTKADRIPYSISKDGILYVKDVKEGL